MIFLCFQILPGLESFCAYCAIGIGAIYLFQCSWFVAWLSLDQRRIEARRDGLIPCCLVHKDWNPSTHKNQDNWTRNAFTYFANLVRNKIFKVSKPLTFFVVSGFFLVSGRTRKVLTKMRNFLASTFSKSREKFSIDRKSPSPKKFIDVFWFFFFLLFLQIWVLITTLALVSVGTWGTLLIRQHFDPVLLLPANTYLRSYLAVHRNHFPQVGLTENKPLGILRGGLSFSKQKQTLT